LVIMALRLLDYSVADGPRQMAADEALLESAAAGVASLRFYAWADATLSLGYFQPEQRRHEDERLARLPWVRRPSGGGAIIHHLEITYALALPAGRPWQDGRSWLLRMHEVIAAALSQFGVASHPYAPSPGEPAFTGFLCFQHFTAGDLMMDGYKVVGSAQRRLRKAIVQHGSILLAASPHAPMLPGIRELSGKDLSVAEVVSVLSSTFRRETDWPLSAESLTDAERERIRVLARDKYGHPSWNAKR
jgi:lipoyl(octanoyl) transferase